MSKETEVPADEIFGARLRTKVTRGEGQEIAIRADGPVREVLAGRLGVLSVDEFAAEIEAVPFDGGVRVAGHLTARLHQACVITLEPVAQTIEVTLDRTFLRGPGPDKPPSAPIPGPGEYVPPERVDPPDWFEGDWIDLDVFLLETVALALDPYPRADNARLQTPEQENHEPDSPFAVLAGLKTKPSD
jgi:uncharacterized metal-binding protein YceD (DUF177 family)